MNIQTSAMVLLLASFLGQAKPARTPTRQQETPHLEFVKEFVRELIEDEDLKTQAEKEFGKAQTPNQQFSEGIYFSKSSQLSLRSQSSRLKSMHLNDPFGDLIANLVALNQHQIDLHQKLIDMDGKFLSGPKPGVDYQALAAKLPEIRAELDESRKTLMDAAALVFMSLINDRRSDSQNHANHLIITKAEKATCWISSTSF